MGREEIVKEALELPEDQRISLAHRLLRSVEPPESPDTAAAWDKEIRERIAKYDRGESRPIPASEVFAELERKRTA